MISLTHPQSIDQDDLLLRDWVQRVVNGELIPTVPEKPEGFPRISLIMIVKNEWATLERCILSVAPILDELIIGVDKETDSPIAFAYEETFACKPREEAEHFFAKFLPEGRYATIEEIADFIGERAEDLRSRCEQKSREKPTLAAATRAVEFIGKGEVIDLDFNLNFAEARNKTLERATGDLILYLDGHEYLEGIEQFATALMEEAPKKDWKFGYVRLDERDVEAQNGILQNRLFKNLPGVRFERGVHNKVMMPGLTEDEPEKEPLLLKGVILVHDRPAWLASFRKTQRQEMTETYMGEGNDSPSLFHSGVNAFIREDWDTALERFDKYLELVEMGPESAYICWLKARILEKEKQDPAAGKQALIDGTIRYPNAAWIWLEMSRIYLDAARNAKNEETREEHAEGALAYARIAAACELTLHTTSIPTTCYTWEPLIRLAEIYGFLGNYENAQENLQKAMFYRDSIPFETLEKADKIFIPTKIAAARKASDETRVSLHSDRKILTIFDRTLQFTREVMEIGEELGYEVEIYREFEPRIAYRGDIWWCDWADENAVLASRTYRGDRKLIVRCHSYEAFGPTPGEILWQNVDRPLAAAPNTLKRLEECYGINPTPFQILTVYPNPDLFPQTTQNRRDVALVGRFTSKKGFELLPDLAALLPDRLIWVAGTIQDERLYEQIVERSMSMGVSNLNFVGHLSDCERNDFYTQAGHYVSLSPWETLSVACCEAELCGLPVYTLDYEWSRLQTPDTYARFKTLEEMAESIESGERKAPDRGINEERYASMKETIRGLLAA